MRESGAALAGKCERAKGFRVERDREQSETDDVHTLTFRREMTRRAARDGSFVGRPLLLEGRSQSSKVVAPTMDKRLRGRAAGAISNFPWQRQLLMCSSAVSSGPPN